LRSEVLTEMIITVFGMWWLTAWYTSTHVLNYTASYPNEFQLSKFLPLWTESALSF
jgi:hypothetical protein